MDVMLSIMDESNVPSQEADVTIKSTCLSLVLGGIDTNVVTLTWAVSLLLNNRDVLKKARDELDIHLGKELQVEESDISNLVYLQAIIKETMRLYPEAPLSVPREDIKDCTIAGFYVPEGTRLFVNLWKLQRDPSIWHKPLDFIPERFLSGHANMDHLVRRFNGAFEEILKLGKPPFLLINQGSTTISSSSEFNRLGDRKLLKSLLHTDVLAIGAGEQHITGSGQRANPRRRAGVFIFIFLAAQPPLFIANNELRLFGRPWSLLEIVSTSRYSKFDLGQYPDFDLGQYLDFDDVLEEETNPACNDFDIDQYPNFDDETAAVEEDVADDNEEEVTTVNEHVEHPFCNSYNPEEEKEEEEIPKEKSPKKMPREYNWNMPELLQIPEEELVKIAVDCYIKIIRIKKDDCFDTKEDLKIALYTKCVEDGYQLKVNKSRKDRFETRVYRGHKIMTDMNARFKISISYSQAWRAKCYALELLRGSPEASFAQLPAYCHNLKLKNHGSVTHIKTDRDGRFELLFIAIGDAIRSFITCMRPVIIVDGAHLKGRYLGVNLLVVAMDANNGILPIAYGVGKSETSDSWIWFMGHLRDYIGPISNLTIISDRANSIDNAVRRCFPYAFHGLCGVHLYRNLKSRPTGIKNHKWTYWKAVKAYWEVDFNKHINCLRRVLPQCAQTLEDVGFERWSRLHQLGARYGFMTSNSAESINALSRHSQKLPITMLIEFFRASIQQWYYKKRNHAGTLEHRVTPWTEKKITNRVVKSTSWRVEPCSNTLFEVLDNNLNGLVDLNAKLCSCMKWQTSGYPCGHVIKVALHLNQDDSSAYAMDCYTTEVYRQTYAEIIYPIPHPSE
ncbi:Protopine 6-monooxygenase [Hibiscus syriacus]|uniref:Protopine 6-monooxygenase n=1 Tax=Hibiscus syriacus TaxID=106335 RepID=A0A6A3B5A3_HIBSY|nr:Protopine 6-monooxygenase [Hibiscus syriacus]